MCMRGHGFATNLLLGLSDPAGSLSLAMQLGSMIVAVLIGRFVFRSRSAIWIIAFMGAFGAILASVTFDGQGAFLLLLYAPIIYFIAVVGRRDLP